jgi:hypothetical protein
MNIRRGKRLRGGWQSRCLRQTSDSDSEWAHTHADSESGARGHCRWHLDKLRSRSRPGWLDSESDSDEEAVPSRLAL